MKKPNSRNVAEQYLSIRHYSRNFFDETDCLFNDQILRTLLILWDRQSQDMQTQVTDTFPQPGISDRTRLLYVRLMVKRGFLNPLTTTLNMQSVLSLSNDTQDRFMTTGDLEITK